MGAGVVVDSGPILLLTRPAAASARFLARFLAGLTDVPVRVVVSPLIDIVPLAGIRDSAAVSALILTSENGAAMAVRMGYPPRLVAYCVGEQTARAADTAGFAAVTAGGDADSLVSLILSLPDVGPMIHLRGEYARGDIAARLGAAGRRVTDSIVYRQVERLLTQEARDVLAGTEPVVLALFSPRTATILTAQGPFSAPLHVVAISKAVAAAADRLAPDRIDVAESADGPAMLMATLSRLRALGVGPAA